jgi:hypothetical protein
MPKKPGFGLIAVETGQGVLRFGRGRSVGKGYLRRLWLPALNGNATQGESFGG